VSFGYRSIQLLKVFQMSYLEKLEKIWEFTTFWANELATGSRESYFNEMMEATVDWLESHN
jgi:hypothetical protein